VNKGQENGVAGNNVTSHSLPGEGASTNSTLQVVERQRLHSFQQYRSLLFAIAYRMLGSATDAEDLLQETFIRWQQTSDLEIKSQRGLLVTILTRLAINQLQSARMKREQYFGNWLPEPVLTGPGQNPSIALEVNESVSLAFLLLLERLTPVERATLLLREVFDFEYSEISVVLEQSESNCRQILRRARQHIKERRSRFEASREQHDELLRRFTEASSQGNLEGLVALLSRDAVFYSDGGGKGPALPRPIYRPENIARGILEGLKKLVPKNLVRRPVEINGKPGIVSFLDGQPFSVFTLDVADGLISHIYVVTNPTKLKRIPPLESFHLPEFHSQPVTDSSAGRS
jgi:RNA polymerase sigma-70 factor (ECF subfamily)